MLLSGVGGAVRRIGGGLEIACEVELPSNPGLGVGGIFGAVLLSSLYALSDQQIDRTNVIKEALYMEQLLGFSGGWQNVVGGVEGGIKVVSSSAGLAPAPSVIRRLDQDADVSSGAIEALKRRMVLCYIGPGANSRPLLLKLVGDYLSRKPEALDARGEMERLTNQVIRHLSSGNLDELGRDLGRIWQKHKV